MNVAFYLVFVHLCFCFRRLCTFSSTKKIAFYPRYIDECIFFPHNTSAGPNCAGLDNFLSCCPFQHCSSNYGLCVTSPAHLGLVRLRSVVWKYLDIPVLDPVGWARTYSISAWLGVLWKWRFVPRFRILDVCVCVCDGDNVTSLFWNVLRLTTATLQYTYKCHLHVVPTAGLLTSWSMTSNFMNKINSVEGVKYT